MPDNNPDVTTHAALEKLAQRLQIDQQDRIDLIDRHFLVSAVFTLEGLPTTLETIAKEDPSLTSPKTLGMFFRMPPSPEQDGSEAITSINVKQLISQVGDDTLVDEPSLTSGDAPSLTIKPFLFIQRRALPDDIAGVPKYNDAAAFTAPRLLEAPELTMADLDNYQDWVELSYLSRSDIDNLTFLTQGRETSAQTILFSGAKVRYVTLHHPQFRFEAHTKTNRNNPGEKIGPDINYPFTLKGEPIAEVSKLNTEDFLDELKLLKRREDAASAPAETEGVEGVDPFPDTSEIELSDAPSFSPPGAAMMMPCPPVWDLPEEIGVSMRLAFSSASPRTINQFQQALYHAMVTPEVNFGREPLKIDIPLKDFAPGYDDNPDPDPGTDPDIPVLKPKGCMNRFGLLLGSIVALLYLILS